jgi:P27 family predicted phage terminase small subunit
MKKNQIPKHLNSETKKWFKEVLNNYELESHHIKLLTLAAEAWDRCSQAREAIAKHGLFIKDRYGSIKINPACNVERDSKIIFARLLRELGFDLERGNETNRPPRLY